MKKIFIAISFPLLILFLGKCGKKEWTEIDIDISFLINYL